MTKKEKINLWGNFLYGIFKKHIDKDGYLTVDWAEIIENEIPQFDEDYNDNPNHKRAYQLMYTLDFEYNSDETKVIPLIPSKELKPFKLFANGKEYIICSFNESKALNFLRDEYDILAHRVIEIPESELDIKNIKIYEDNDTSKEPFYVSIREEMSIKEECLISTNDYDIFY